MADLSKPVMEENIRVTRADFLRALDEVRPSYGAATETLEQYRPGGMLDIGPQYHAPLAELQQLLESVEQQEAVPLSAALLWGDSGTGKTGEAWCAWLGWCWHELSPIAVGWVTREQGRLG